MRLKQQLLIIACTCACSLVYGQSGTALHLQPHPDSPVYLEAETAGIDLSEVIGFEEDESLPPGWNKIEYSGGITGFVADSKISKSLNPVDGAAIHLRGDETSPIITTFREGEVVEIIDTGLWWEILLERPLELFFYTPSVETAAFPEQEPEFEEAAPVQINQESVGLVDTPADSYEIYTAPADEPTALEPKLQEPDTAVAIDTGNQVIDVPLDLGSSSRPEVKESTPATGLPITLEGTLRRTSSTFGRSPYSYELISTEGRRLAWIDFTDLVLSGTIDRYTGRSVIVHGEQRFRPGREELVLRVRSLRRK